MRKSLAVISICLFLIGACGVLFAQQKTVTRADIKFEFYVDTLMFPPGSYYFEAVDHPGPYLKIIRQGGGATNVKMVRDIVKTEPVKQGKLVFLYQDGKMVLHQVLAPGDYHAHDILHSTAVPEMTAEVK